MQEYSKKFLDNFFMLLTSIKGLIMLFISQLVAIQGVKVGLISLGSVFITDLITGIIASWIEPKIGPQGAYFLESRKLRRTLLKAITYLVFVVMSWLAYYLFFDAKISLPVSTRSFTIVEIAFGICIAIECWSILENFKRMGFDIVGKITETAKRFWKTTNTIKNGE